MLVDPEVHEIVYGQRGMLVGIDACIYAKCLVSAVSLIYSTIDALSALTRPINQKDTDTKVFVDWINEYLKPENQLGCTAIDLYGARCGVLHTYGMDSRKHREGKAKPLVYQWENGPNPDLNKKVQLPKDSSTLTVESLHGALLNGISNFENTMNNNPDIKKIVDYHKEELLCYKPWRST